jgi:hypothetical protein
MFAEQPDTGDGKAECRPVWTYTLGDDFSTLIVTGPNAGGKTVAMKTVGLVAHDAESRGIPVPLDDDEVALPRYSSALMVEIGDDQSIEDDLSTFSSHVTHLKLILDPEADRPDPRPYRRGGHRYRPHRRRRTGAGSPRDSVPPGACASSRRPITVHSRRLRKGHGRS